MRTATQWLCDLRGTPGCEETVAVTFVCKVEGREVALCGNCDRHWKGYARDNPGLEWRCPNCAPQFLAGKVTSLNTTAHEEPILTGPIADLIDQCMYRNGILVDVRRRVLAALYKEAKASDGYPAMLLRSTAGVS